MQHSYTMNSLSNWTKNVMFEEKLLNFKFLNWKNSLNVGVLSKWVRCNQFLRCLKLLREWSHCIYLEKMCPYTFQVLTGWFLSCRDRWWGWLGLRSGSIGPISFRNIMFFFSSNYATYDNWEGVPSTGLTLLICSRMKQILSLLAEDRSTPSTDLSSASHHLRRPSIASDMAPLVGLAKFSEDCLLQCVLLM